MYMGMGKAGIPWVQWDSHGNGNKISHGMEMEIKFMGWELRRGSGKRHCIQHGVNVCNVLIL